MSAAIGTTSASAPAECAAGGRLKIRAVSAPVAEEEEEEEEEIQQMHQLQFFVFFGFVVAKRPSRNRYKRPVYRPNHHNHLKKNAVKPPPT